MKLIVRHTSLIIASPSTIKPGLSGVKLETISDVDTVYWIPTFVTHEIRTFSVTVTQCWHRQFFFFCKIWESLYEKKSVSGTATVTEVDGKMLNYCFKIESP